MKFRRATRADLDRLVEIHAAAYPDARNESARRRNFTSNPFGRFDRLVVASEEGSIVGHAFSFDFETWFGGASVRMGGIASVAVAPEARGRGVATALMGHLHALSDRRGEALTMLHAFRQGFYAQLGYASTSSRKRLAIDTRSIPAAWRVLARSRVRGARGSDRGMVIDVYERAARRSSGWIARSKAFWDGLLGRERRITLVCEGPPPRSKDKPGLSGYVAFTLAQAEPHAETAIFVDELVCDDDASRRALLGALSAMRDQVSEIVLEVPESDPLERALIDADGRRFGTESVEHSLGEIVGGPMVRIGDVRRALEARGYFDRGAFDLVLEDDEESSALGVCVRDGRAEVNAARTKGGAVATSRAGLAALLYGGLSLGDAVALGVARAEPSVVARVGAVLRLPPLCPIDAF